MLLGQEKPKRHPLLAVSCKIGRTPAATVASRHKTTDSGNRIEAVDWLPMRAASCEHCARPLG
jgi:hypothetical protein